MTTATAIAERQRVGLHQARPVPLPPMAHQTTRPTPYPTTAEAVATRRSNGSKGTSVMSFQAFFAKRFAAFLRENFTSAEHIAICFGVTARQAQNWLDETSAPRGHVVARAFTDPRFAESAHRHLRAVE